MTDYEKEQLKGCIKLYFNSIAEYDPTAKKWYSPFRPKERTASVSINKDNNFIDFGNTDYKGDIFTAYALYNKLDIKNDFKQIAEALSNQFNITLTEPKNKDVKIPQQQLAQHGLTLEKQEPQKDYTEKYKEWHKALEESTEAKAYLTKRHISEEQVKKYNIGYDPNTNKIVIPCNKFYFKERSINDNVSDADKHNKTSGLHPILWLSDKMKALNESDIIYVFESITDALMLESIAPCVALNGTGQYKKFLDLMKDKGYKNKVALLLDNDDGGRTTSEKIAEELKKRYIECISYNDPNTIKKYNYEIQGLTSEIEKIDAETKAINDYKQNKTKDNKDKTKEQYTQIYEGQKDLNDFINSITIKIDGQTKPIEIEKVKVYAETITNEVKKYFKYEAEEFKKELIKNFTSSSIYIDTLISNIEKSNLYEPISTNITPLDEALSGGLYAKQLVVLVAETSLGKTAFALQLADTIAQTQPVLYFSLEMNRDELLARSLSRTLYQRIRNIDFNGQNFNLTALDILKGKYKNNISLNNYFNEAIAEYKSNVKDNLFFYECTDTEESKIESIKKRILDFIQATNQLKPVVFIDYLQFIESGLTHGTDKQDIDFIVKELKNLARQQAINIFLISSTSRGYYEKQLDIGASKESGNIEYTADVLIGLDLQAKEENAKSEKMTPTEKENLKEARKANPRNIKLSILKNRNGRRDIDINNISYDARYNLYDFSKTADDDGWQSIE